MGGACLRCRDSSLPKLSTMCNATDQTRRLRHGGGGRACSAVLFCGAVWSYLPSQPEMIHTCILEVVGVCPNVYCDLPNV